MAYTDNLGSVNHSAAYAASFGAIPDGTAYQSADLSVKSIKDFEKIAVKSDFRPELWKAVSEQLKAIQAKAAMATDGGAGTAGYAMVPVYVDPNVVDVSRKYTPLVELIQRVTNMGTYAAYNKITAKGGGYTAVENAALPDKNNTKSREATAIKYLYAKGSVTGQARASWPSYTLTGFRATGSGLAGTGFAPESGPNAKQFEVILQTRAIRELEENLIVNGNATSDATQYDGIVQLMSTTNTVAKSSTALTYDDTETAMTYAIEDSGRPNLGICDTRTLADLRKIMINKFNYRPSDMTVSLPFGVSSHLLLETSIGPIPMLFSQYLTSTAGSKSMYLLDMNHWEMRVLQDLTYEELAKTNDAEPFMLKIYEALICKNTSFNASITSIA